MDFTALILFAGTAFLFLACTALLWIDHGIYNTQGVIELSIQEAVNTVVAQLNKAHGEIMSKIADVEAQIEAAGVAGQVDLSALVAAAQALDDIVPDAVEDPAEVDTVEVPEPVVEGEPVVEDAVEVEPVVEDAVEVAGEDAVDPVVE